MIIPIMWKLWISPKNKDTGHGFVQTMRDLQCPIDSIVLPLFIGKARIDHLTDWNLGFPMDETTFSPLLGEVERKAGISEMWYGGHLSHHFHPESSVGTIPERNRWGQLTRNWTRNGYMGDDKGWWSAEIQDEPMGTIDEWSIKVWWIKKFNGWLMS